MMKHSSYFGPPKDIYAKTRASHFLNQFIKTASLAAITFAFSASAQAAVYIVNNATELETLLTQNDLQNAVIQLNWTGTEALRSRPVISQPLTLEAAPGKQPVLLHDSIRRHLKIHETTGVVVRGITFQGKSGTASGGSGGGVIVGWHAKITFENCSFLDNTASGSNPDGDESEDGGGIFSWVSELTLNNVLFRGNTAVSDGGALRTGGGGKLDMTRVTFIGNTSSDTGGALYTGVPTTLRQGAFYGNTSPSGGAIYADNMMSLTKTTFVDNTATRYGGAVFSTNFYPANLTQTTFYDNSAPEGGALYVSGGGSEPKTVNMAASLFVGNHATDAGSEIFVAYDNPLVSWGGNIVLSGLRTLCVAPTVGGSETCTPLNPFTQSSDRVSAGNTAAAVFGSNTLKDNGGPVPTLALTANSPAINALTEAQIGDIIEAIGNAVTPDDAVLLTNFGTDARGAARPYGAGYDVGAYEYGATAPQPGASFDEQTTATQGGQSGATTVQGAFGPDTDDQGKTGSVFIVAFLPANLPGIGNTLWALDGNLGWHLLAGDYCSQAPAYYSGPLAAGNVPILPSPADISILRNTILFIGYGTGSNSRAACNNMLTTLKLKAALTLR